MKINKRYIVLLINLALVFSGFSLKGQVSDTVIVKANSYFTTKDTTVFFSSDTLLVVPANLKYKVKEDQKALTETFYDSLYLRSQDKWLSSELYGFVFRKPVKEEGKEHKKLKKSQDPFKEYEGKIIGNIYISNLNFLYSSNQVDSVNQADLLNKSVSNLHVTTHKRVIEKTLTFDTDDKVNSFILAENERILRQLSALKDARITILEREGTQDTVDIIVTTVDVFPFGVAGSFASFQNFKLGFYNTNFLGSGVEWRNLFVYKTKYDPDWGFEGKFKYNNIYASFIDAAIYYKATEPYSDLRGVLNRDLSIPSVELGGAVDIGIKSFIANERVEDTVYKDQITTEYQDYWLGYKFLTKKNLHRNLVLKGRYFVENFTERPYVDADTNYRYHKKKNYFGSISLYNVRYLKSRYILGFGITEDVPYGFISQLTAGYETSEFFEYPYVGFDIAYAKYFKNVGYFQVIGNYGGYFQNSSMVSEIYRVNIKTFSNLFSLGNYKLREFIQLHYMQGNHIFDEKRDLELKKYIQGLKHESIEGNIRTILGSETVLFTPWYWYGFRTVVLARLEAGFVGTRNNYFSSKNFHSGISMGFNIRNESLVFDTFSLRISYYPGNPNYGNFWGITASFSDPKFFRDLSILKPGIVEFK